MAPTPAVKTCTRTGCGKQLRKDNLKGVCSSNCLSPDAPAADRDPNAEYGPNAAITWRKVVLES